MAKTTKFEKLVLESFYNKFHGKTAMEKFGILIVDPMIMQILFKNQEEKFFVDNDKKSIELLEIILARQNVFVQQYNGPRDSKLHHNDRSFYSDKFLRGELYYSNECLFDDRAINDKFYRDGLSEFLLKLLNNRNFFMQMKDNRKNIMLFLLLFEYESNYSDSRYCNVEYKRAIYSNARRPFIIKFQFPECATSIEMEECPLSNYVIALYVKNMISNENFINHLVSNEVKLRDFIEGISEMKYKNRDVVKELLVNITEALLKNKILMNKVTKNLDNLSKLLKSDIAINLLEDRRFIVELIKTNKDFIIHIAELAGYKAEYLELDIRMPESNDSLLVRCIKEILGDACKKILAEEEKINTNIKHPILTCINTESCIDMHKILCR